MKQNDDELMILSLWSKSCVAQLVSYMSSNHGAICMIHFFIHKKRSTIWKRKVVVIKNLQKKEIKHKIPRFINLIQGFFSIFSRRCTQCFVFNFVMFLKWRESWSIFSKIWWIYESIKSYILPFHIVTNCDDFWQMFWVILSFLILLKKGNLL